MVNRLDRYHPAHEISPLIRYHNQRYDVSWRGFLSESVHRWLIGVWSSLHHCAPSDYDEWPKFLGKTKDNSIWSYKGLKK